MKNDPGVTLKNQITNFAANEDPKDIRKIHEHMGLATKPPLLHPVRGRPKVQNHFENGFNQQHLGMNFDNFNHSAD